MGAFVAKLLLPTVSSLVLLPVASVATKRGFHSEALVYFFTMFFTMVRPPAVTPRSLQSHPTLYCQTPLSSVPPIIYNNRFYTVNRSCMCVRVRVCPSCVS